MSEWQFFLDENIDPKVATYLNKEQVFAEHVRETVGLGADDEADILPYIREHDQILVTSDITDFAPLNTNSHSGIVLLYDDTLPAYQVASALIAIVDEPISPYQRRTNFLLRPCGRSSTSGSVVSHRATVLPRRFTLDLENAVSSLRNSRSSAFVSSPRFSNSS